MTAVPLLLFITVYLAAFVLCGFFLRPYAQWAALLSVTVATTIAIVVWDQRRFSIGFLVRPVLAARELLLGFLFALILIGTADAAVVLITGVRQSWAGAFPVRDLIVLFIPAAVHEELAFRGYAYQKLRLWSRPVAVALSSAVFALLHRGNHAVSPLALVNIFIAGVLLALAFERFERMWFPIGIHFAWNVLSGPVFGFPVSGFVTSASLIHVAGTGGTLITGGAFGIEASVLMTVAEIFGIVYLWLAVEHARSNHT